MTAPRELRTDRLLLRRRLAADLAPFAGFIGLSIPRFEVLRIEEIVAFTAPGNARSRRVMEKIGMS